MGAILRFIAIGLALVVAAGFIAFAVDEMDRGSKTQQQALSTDGVTPTAAPSAGDEKAREKRNGSLREGIDDANDVLLQPFADLVSSTNNWITHGVPALLGLLVYGLGIGTLANFLPKTHRADDWRAA